MQSQKKKYKLTLKILKKNSNKIKNKTGKIIRYTVSVSVIVTLTNIEEKDVNSRTLSRNSNLDISDNHSETIDNEKKAIQNIIDQLSEDIINYIFISTQPK